MNKKSFFLGVLVGVVLTFGVLFVIGLEKQKSSESDNDPIKYLETPVSYENKTKTSFKVFQTFEGAALATEVSNKEHGWYTGKTVLLMGNDFYSEQVVNIKNPQRIGSYSYTSKGGTPLTVPVITGSMDE